MTTWQVGASTDDAFEGATGTMNLTDTTVGAITSTSQWAGGRFVNVTIPSGDIIDTAKIELYKNGASNLTAVMDVYLEAADSPGTFTSTSGNISGRTRTTEKGSINTTVTANAWFEITGLAAALQAIVSRPGWASGNSVVAIFDSLNGNGIGWRSWDGDPTFAMKLTVTHHTPGGGALVQTQVPGMLIINAGMAGQQHLLMG